VADLPGSKLLQGRIVASGKNLGKLPIIDSRGFDESASTTSGAASPSAPALTPRTGQPRKSGDVALRDRPAAATAAQSRGDAAIVPDHGQLAVSLTISAPKATLNSVRTQAQ